MEKVFRYEIREIGTNKLVNAYQLIATYSEMSERFPKLVEEYPQHHVDIYELVPQLTYSTKFLTDR